MANKLILYSYFQKTAKVLLSEYNRSKEQNTSSNLGKNREYFVKNFYQKYYHPNCQYNQVMCIHTPPL